MLLITENERERNQSYNDDLLFNMDSVDLVILVMSKDSIVHKGVLLSLVSVVNTYYKRNVVSFCTK